MSFAGVAHGRRRRDGRGEGRVDVRQRQVRGQRGQKRSCGSGARDRRAPAVLAKGGRLRDGEIRGGRRGGVGVVNRVLDCVDGNYMADHDGNIFRLWSWN